MVPRRPGPRTLTFSFPRRASYNPNPSSRVSQVSRVLRRSQPLSRRSYSTPASSQSPSAAPSRARTRLQSFNNRLPRFLQPYTTPLLSAPVTHVTSFLILHEITAVVPLFGLAGLFHYAGWIPDIGTWSSSKGEGEGEGDGALDEGVKRFGKWLRKKGWVGEEAEVDAEAEVAAAGGERKSSTDRGVRLVLEFATAYAITKALLPVRIMASVWATPWFARRVLGPVGRWMGRVFGRREKKA